MNATTRERRNATPEDAVRMRELRAAGKEVKEISEITGFSRGVVTTYTNLNPFTEDEEAVVTRLLAGESQIAIARTLTERKDRQGFVSRTFRRAVAAGRISDSGTATPAKPLKRASPLEAAEAIRNLNNGTAIFTAPPKTVELPNGHTATVQTEPFSGEALDAMKVVRDIREEGLKTRLLRQLDDHGRPYETTEALMDDVRLWPGDGSSDSYGYHEVQHLLRTSLNRMGYVKFRVDRIGKHSKLKRIEITTAGKRLINALPEQRRPKPADATSPAAHGIHAVGGPIERRKATPEELGTAEPMAKDHPWAIAHEGIPSIVAAPDLPEPEEADLPLLDTENATDEDWAREHRETDGLHFNLTGLGTSASTLCPLCAAAALAEPVEVWPLLAEMRSRIFRAEARAKLLRQAADLADDDKEREELGLYADSAAAPTLSPIEREYLAFAEAHE